MCKVCGQKVEPPYEQERLCEDCWAARQPQVGRKMLVILSARPDAKDQRQQPRAAGTVNDN